MPNFRTPKIVYESQIIKVRKVGTQKKKKMESRYHRRSKNDGCEKLEGRREKKKRMEANCKERQC